MGSGSAFNDHFNPGIRIMSRLKGQIQQLITELEP